jgi:hypothetical protein
VKKQGVFLLAAATAIMALAALKALELSREMGGEAAEGALVQGELIVGLAVTFAALFFWGKFSNKI